MVELRGSLLIAFRDREQVSSARTPEGFLCPHLMSDKGRRRHVHDTPSQYTATEQLYQVAVARHARSQSVLVPFGARLLSEEYNIHTARESVGHRHLKITTICTHVLKRGGRGMRIPHDNVQARSAESKPYHSEEMGVSQDRRRNVARRQNQIAGISGDDRNRCWAHRCAI